MQLRFFTIPVHGGDEAAEALNRFLGGHRVLAIDRSFVQDGGNSAWSLCVSFKGLPIGALTSQHFANYYLNGLDRLLLERCQVRGMVRYMDDLVWWGDDRTAVRRALTEARAYALGELGLTVKDTARVGRSRDGLTLCGYRILPGRLLLSRRRKRRYAVARRHWEAAFAAGRIDANGLQAGYAAALAITAHADAAAWRREQLRRHPLADALRHL